MNNVVEPLPTRPKLVLNLDEAYKRYQEGKGIGRSDLFGYLIENIKGLQARIGAVDEAAVAALDKRVSGLETVIGNALRESALVTKEPVFTQDEALRRKPGRPSNAELAAREGQNNG